MKTIKISALILTVILSSAIFITPLSSSKDLNNHSNTNFQNKKQTTLSMKQAIHITKKLLISKS